MSTWLNPVVSISWKAVCTIDISYTRDELSTSSVNGSFQKGAITPHTGEIENTPLLSAHPTEVWPPCSRLCVKQNHRNVTTDKCLWCIATATDDKKCLYLAYCLMCLQFFSSLGELRSSLSGCPRLLHLLICSCDVWVDGDDFFFPCYVHLLRFLIQK